jgi:hypothetical protein
MAVGATAARRYTGVSPAAVAEGSQFAVPIPQRNATTARVRALPVGFFDMGVAFEELSPIYVHSSPRINRAVTTEEQEGEGGGSVQQGNGRVNGGLER